MTERAADDQESGPSEAMQRHPQEAEWATLIQQIARGNQQALGHFYDTTSAVVYGLAVRILGNTATAEEVTVDVYTQVWRQALSFDAQRGTPSAWLIMLTRSRALDHLRMHRHAEQQLAPRRATALPAARTTPEEASLIRERRRFVQTALGALPAEQRQVLELVYFSGCSHSEVATQLGVPPGTVKTRLRLGLVKLRTLLGVLAE